MNAVTRAEWRTDAKGIEAGVGSVLLLIPGMLNANGIWDGVISALKAKTRAPVRVMIANVLTQSTIQGMADDAWKSLDDVPDEVAVYVAGFSMGGYVALEMLAHPRRPLREAWLISTSALPETLADLRAREQAIESFENDFEKTIQATARWASFEKSAEQLEPLIRSMRALGATTAVRQIHAIMKRGDLRDRLGALDTPVHVICGAQDRVTPVPLSQELARLIPGAQLQVIEDAGHLLPFEQPTRIAASLAVRITG